MRIDKELRLVGGDVANVSLTLSADRVRVIVAAEGVENCDAWDRARIVGLRTRNVRPGEFLAKLVMVGGDEETLPIILDPLEAQQLSEAF